MTTQIDTTRLRERIEYTFQQSLNEPDGVTKARLEVETRRLATEYHTITGEWYRRDWQLNSCSSELKVRGTGS